MMSEEFERLRRLAGAATPGPWRQALTGDIWTAAGVALRIASVRQGCVSPEDAIFVAAANPSAVISILDRLDILHSALSAALRMTYTPECSRDERWYEERERLNQVLGGEGK